MSQDDLHTRPGYLVKQLQQALRRSCEERLRGLGLSMSQYAVLLALRDAPGASAAELARRTFVTRQSLRDVLSGLTRHGLASVDEAPASKGRAQPVTLTAAGRSAVERADALVAEVEEDMTAGLSAEDVQRLAALLHTCRANLD